MLEPGFYWIKLSNGDWQLGEINIVDWRTFPDIDTDGPYCILKWDIEKRAQIQFIGNDNCYWAEDYDEFRRIESPAD